MRKLTTKELNRLSIEEFKTVDKIPLVIILDNIRSQNNTGSIFRTADAFLLQKIHLCGITATPPHREIHKTALGATQSVSWKYFSSTADSIRELRSAGFKIIAVEQTTSSIPVDQFSPSENTGYAVIFGNEVQGVANDIIQDVDFCIEIPQFGTKHSLNISVAAGIVIWELYKKINNGLKRNHSTTLP
jgi:23S rRNA (guanosine2251-2'-O)-methyltransferase